MKIHDPLEKYCSEIQLLMEGGSTILEPNAGITSDMKGRWTIGSFSPDPHGKKETPKLKELIYPNNMGAMEIFKFFEKASDEEKQRFDQLVNSDDQKSAWNLIEKVLGIKFQGEGPWR
jgi:hypothetical protein